MRSNTAPTILWCGRFSKEEGYATVTKNHFKGLQAIGANVVAYDTDLCQFVGPEAEHGLVLEQTGGVVEIRSESADHPVVVVFHERPDVLPKMTVEGNARFVAHSVFEFTALPPSWPHNLTAVDEVWVASEFNRAGFAASGVPDFMMHKVPHSIDPQLYPASGQTDSETTEFLCVMSSFDRRDLGSLFRAYLRAFDASDNVRLTVKLRDSMKDYVTAEALLRSAIFTVGADTASAIETVRIVPGNFTTEEMVSLVSECDAYISVERANGWDLPLMEAMVSEKPTISFGWGGSTEFADPSVAVRLDTGPGFDFMSQSLTSVKAFNVAQQIPAISDHDLSDALRKLHEDKELRVEMGRAAREHIVTEFSVETVASRIVERTLEFQAHDFRGNHPARIRHKKRGPLWSAVSIPTRVSIATQGVLSRIAEYGAVPSFNVVAKKAAYDRASAARRAHNVSGSTLNRSKPLEQLGTAMTTSSRRPIKKIRALRELDRLAKGMDPGDPRLGTAIQEFWDSESELQDPTDAFMDRRRAIWGRFGAVPLTDDDAERLASLRDRHLGDRVFVIGNGPSLNKLPLDLLAGEYTIGVNKIGLLFDRISWRPSYWTIMDWRVGPEMRDSYSDLDGITKLVPYRFRGVLPDNDETYWYHSRPVGDYFEDQFAPDILNGIPSRGTILVTALQQAFYLGFRDIYVIGVDASYSIPDSVIQTGPDRFGTGIKLNLESTKDDDANHFDPRYFGAGAKWHDPNVNEMLRMFRVMRKGAEFYGGTIRNATAGGNLEVYERVDFESLF